MIADREIQLLAQDSSSWCVLQIVAGKDEANFLAADFREERREISDRTQLDIDKSGVRQKALQQDAPLCRR